MADGIPGDELADPPVRVLVGVTKHKVTGDKAVSVEIRNGGIRAAVVATSADGVDELLNAIMDAAVQAFPGYLENGGRS